MQAWVKTLVVVGDGGRALVTDVVVGGGVCMLRVQMLKLER